jgi:hypothetical protein
LTRAFYRARVATKGALLNKVHALVIAVLLGVAAVAGTYAALETTELGIQAEAATVSGAQLAKREKKLDKAERALTRAANKRPPALPPLPARQSPAMLASSSTSSPPAPASVAAAPVAAAVPSSGSRVSGHERDFDDDRSGHRDDDDWDDDDHSGPGGGGGGDDHEDNDDD